MSSEKLNNQGGNSPDLTRLAKALERIYAGRGENVRFTWKGIDEHEHYGKDRTCTSEHCSVGTVHNDE